MAKTEWTPEQVKALSAAKAKRSKYRNVRTVVNGMTFASKREARRYEALRDLQRLGHISCLGLQHSLPIVVNGVEVARYIADFSYREKGRFVLEDVKSPATAKNRLYLLKKKLVKAIYGYDILET